MNVTFFENEDGQDNNGSLPISGQSTFSFKDGLMNTNEGKDFRLAIFHLLYQKFTEQVHQYSPALVLEVAQQALIFLELEGHEDWPAPHDVSGVQKLVNKVLLNNGSLQNNKLEKEVNKIGKPGGISARRPVQLEKWDFPYRKLINYRKYKTLSGKKKKKPENVNIFADWKNAHKDLNERVPWMCKELIIFKSKAKSTTQASNKKKSKQSESNRAKMSEGSENNNNSEYDDIFDRKRKHDLVEAVNDVSKAIDVGSKRMALSIMFSSSLLSSALCGEKLENINDPNYQMAKMRVVHSLLSEDTFQETDQ
eukprot:Pgem_evm1s6812